MNTTFSSNSSSTSIGISPGRSLTHVSTLVVLGARPWQMAILVATCTTFAFTYALITVATYRVSRTLHPFILFFSEGVANVYTLFAGVVCFGGQLLQVQPLGDPAAEFVVDTLASYACLLHYLVIAVNRAHAVFFPMQYQVVWTRGRIIASVVGVWVLGSALQAIVVGEYFTRHATSTGFRIYVIVQRCVTLPSLSIYSAALGWVLVGRLQLFLEKRRSIRNGHQSTINSSSPVLPTLSSATYAQSIDLRIFAYCFLSFLPHCYNLIIRPRPNSFHFVYYAIVRLFSPGVLLLVMSSATREQMPNPLRRWGIDAKWCWLTLRALLHCAPPPPLLPTAAAAGATQLQQPQLNSNALFSKRPPQQQQQQGGGRGKIAGCQSQIFAVSSPRSATTKQQQLLHQLQLNSRPKTTTMARVEKRV